MASRASLIKIVGDETEEDFQLPERIGYADIENAPNSLKDIDPDAAEALEDVENDFLTLGDLAYLDQITETQIASDAITTPKIAAGAITSSKISVGSLSAITANLGTVTAGSINGLTITGGTIRTSSSGTRVELNGSANEIRIYSGSDLRAVGFDEGWTWYNSSGNQVGTVYAGTSSLSGSRTLLISTSASSTGSIQLGAGSSGYVTMAIGSTNYFYASGSLGYLVAARDIIPVGTRHLGTLGAEWDALYVNNLNVFEDTYFEEGVSIILLEGSVQVLEGFVTLAKMTGTEADDRTDDDDGSMYIRTDGTDVLRVKIGGTWRTVTTT